MFSLKVVFNFFLLQWLNKMWSCKCEANPHLSPLLSVILNKETKQEVPAVHIPQGKKGETCEGVPHESAFRVSARALLAFGPVILWGCRVQWRMFSSVLASTLQIAVALSPPVVATKNVSLVSPWRQNCPLLKTTVLDGVTGWSFKIKTLFKNRQIW